MSDIDAPVWRHLVALVRIGGTRLDAVFAHCEGWPSSSAATWPRVAWLRARRIKTDIVYVNTVGRSVAQVHGERRLRQAVEEFLDGKQTEWHGSDPVSIHTAVRQFVAGRPDLRWARCSRPAAPDWAFRVRSKLNKVGGALLVLLFSPLLLAWRPCGPCCCAATSGGTCPTHPSHPAASVCASSPISKTTWCRTRSRPSAWPSRAASGS